MSESSVPPSQAPLTPPGANAHAALLAGDAVAAKYFLSYAIARGVNAAGRLGEVLEVRMRTRVLVAEGQPRPESYEPDTVVLQILLVPQNVAPAQAMSSVWTTGPGKGARAPRLVLPPGTRKIPSN